VSSGQLWDERHRTTSVDELSWFQPVPVTSVALIDRLGVERHEPVIDVGGGASTLAGALLERGFTDVTVLDISAHALRIAAEGLVDTQRVSWVVADIRSWQPSRTWQLWHDRAVFHFLTTDHERDAYLRALANGLPPRGALIVATFAPDGPERCSGLPLQRYNAESLVSAISSRVPLDVVTTLKDVHVTPRGDAQPFTWVAARRRALRTATATRPG
jgi:SAM-dependent methyltransferase